MRSRRVFFDRRGRRRARPDERRILQRRIFHGERVELLRRKQLHERQLELELVLHLGLLV
jgi:hypothetical protein